MDKAIAVELVKGVLQLAFTWMQAGGLTEEEKDILLDGERARFNKNIQTPLPDV